MIKQVYGEIQMIPSHLFLKIYLSMLEPDDCIPPKCCELSEYTVSGESFFKMYEWVRCK